MQETVLKLIFEKYNWDKKVFCEILNEPEMTFNYLNERFIKGSENLNNILKKKTKIVATIGMNSATEEMLAKMSQNGVNIFRLNLIL